MPSSFKPSWIPSREEATRQYDRRERNKESQAFYKSKAWRDKRILILARDNHLCVLCKAKGRAVPASAVDHIIPLLQAPELALADSNLRSLCRACHNKVRTQQTSS